MNPPLRDLVAGSLLLFALCGCALYPLLEFPRFSYSFDAGHGRTVEVWSAPRSIWDRNPGAFGTPWQDYYRIEQDGNVLVPTTYMGSLDEAAYQFQGVTAEEGAMICIWAIDPKRDAIHLVILYDAESRESYPRDLRWEPEEQRKWLHRFERVLREHPQCPVPEELFR